MSGEYVDHQPRMLDKQLYVCFKFEVDYLHILPRYNKEKKITLQERFIAHVTANLLFINSLFWNKDCLGSSCPKSLILFKS